MLLGKMPNIPDPFQDAQRALDKMNSLTRSMENSVLSISESILKQNSVAVDASKALETLSGINDAQEALGSISSLMASRLTGFYDGIAQSVERVNAPFLRSLPLAGFHQEQLIEAINRLITNPFAQLAERFYDLGIDAEDIHTEEYLVLAVAIRQEEERNPGFVKLPTLTNLITYDIATVVEKELRSLVATSMFETYGTTWWDYVPQNVGEQCTGWKQRKEATTGKDLHEIAYSSMNNMRSILANQPLWNDVFASRLVNSTREDIDGKIDLIIATRDNVAHLREVSVVEFAIFVWRSRFLIYECRTALGTEPMSDD